MQIKLTPREQEVLELLSECKSNKDIAKSLIIGESTVNTHVINITGKFCVEGDNARMKAVILAIQNNLIDVSAINII
jgi:DNA-binding NarL/FixJ family response regulator